MMLVFALMIAAGLAGLLFAGSAILLMRRDRRRFLKAVDEGRFDVARVDRGFGESYNTVEIAGVAGGLHFVLLAVTHIEYESTLYRLTLGGSYPHQRRRRDADIQDPVARAFRLLLHHVRARSEGPVRKTAA